MKKIDITAPAPLYTNTFILIGNSGTAAVIDPGAAPEQYVKELEAHGAKLKYIFLTHGHYDHVGAAEYLRKKYGAKVFLAQEDRGGSRLFPLKDEDCDGAYTDAEVIQIDDFSVRVIKTPGHSLGSVCLFVEGENLLFTGDTVFREEIGRCDLEGGSFDTILKSLKKLCGEVSGNPQVLPGHDVYSTLEHEKQNNEYFKRAL